MINQLPPPISHITIPPNRLALRVKETAKALGIGERLLWDLTNNGVIPHLRLGSKVIVYPVDTLQAWLASEAAKGVQK